MRKNYLNYLLLITISLGLILITKNSSFFFGSNIDWFNQHVVFADYLRTLFYNTGNLFPNFALNLGSGINIFSLSYYGLYSPFILISYFLPFIPMINYLQIINIVLYISTVLLTYKFLIHKDLSRSISLIGALLMAFATPLLFQFHRQFMFVNYLPFLIIGLFSVDKYFATKRKTLLIISVFLMIMTSYYFSIGGILVLIVYGYYNYLTRNSHLTREYFKKTILPFFISILIGVGAASILLLPTFYALASGREGAVKGLSLLMQLLPNPSFFNLLYHPYNLGLTAVSLVALIYSCLSKNKAIKHLGIILLLLVLFPVFSLILNGGLYARGKVLLPFLPLFIFIMALFLENIKNNKLPNKKVILLTGIITSLFLVIGFVTYFSLKDYFWIFLVDSIITMFLWYKVAKGKTKLFIIFPVLIAGILAISINKSEDYININNHNNQERADTVSLINQVITNDQSFYRMFNNYRQAETINEISNINYYSTSIYSSIENQYYQNFLNNTFKVASPLDNKLMLISSVDPLFMTFMNTKYLITAGVAPLGYQLEKDTPTFKAYLNSNTLPLAYVTDKIISEQDFNNLSYPETIGALFSGVVANKSTTVSEYLDIKEFNLNNSVISKDFEITKKDNGYTFEIAKNGELTIKLTEKLKNQIMMLSFDIKANTKCTEGGQVITINGITNQVSCANYSYANNNNTFHYNLSSNQEWDQLNITFNQGSYYIENIKAYIIDYNDVLKYVKGVNPYIIDKQFTKGDNIMGTVKADKPGYFVTSLPYDDNYIITDNGNLVKPEKVNTAFIGFPITEGVHKIEISYQAKGHKIGKILSFSCLIITFIIFLFETFKSKSKREFVKKCQIN
ncbi:MAG: YfhO family protein [Bacilli bacterium]